MMVVYVLQAFDVVGVFGFLHFLNGKAKFKSSQVDDCPIDNCL